MSDENSNSENDDENLEGNEVEHDSRFLFPAVISQGGGNFAEPKGNSEMHFKITNFC